MSGCRCFRSNGFSNDGRRAMPPDEPLDLYRGATEDHRFGMAWTSALDVAERFARKEDGAGLRGRVYTARVDPLCFLAY